MTTYLVLSFLLSAIMGGSEAERSAHLPAKPLKVGLVTDGPVPAPAESAPDESNSCTGVSFTRNLKYG
jgi:hypothetical protein